MAVVSEESNRDDVATDAEQGFVSYDPTAEFVTYVSDVEGHWDYFCNFVELSRGVRFVSSCEPRKARTSKDLELELEHGWQFVFGGDTCDKGPGTLRFLEAVVRLKKKYPRRVHLLLGNRDVNKLRFTSEIAQTELDRFEEVPAAYWVAPPSRLTPLQYLRQLAAQEEGITEEMLAEAGKDDRVRKRNTKANKLRYMLKHDMGGDGEFEFRREELAYLRDVPVTDVTDDDVVQSYEDSIAANGWLRSYLEESQIGVRLGDTLFVHGQIIGNSFQNGQCRGVDENGVAQCIGVVPNEAETFSDVGIWLTKINTWCRHEIADWIARPQWEVPPLDPSYEGPKGWRGRGGAALIDYATPTSVEPTVIYCRYLTETAMPLRYPDDLVELLRTQGIRYVIVGHTPHGNAPTVIRSGGVCTIAADTSYSHMQSNIAFNQDNRGRAACDVFLENGALGVKGYTEKEQLIDYYVAPDGDGMTVGGAEEFDPYVGRMLDNFDESDRPFFVKARLVKVDALNTMPEDHYLVTHINGFHYDYATIECEQMQKAIEGSLLQATGSQVVLRREFFSCGDLYSHSFHSDGGAEMVDYLFRRIDKDGNGNVTKSELLAACTDRFVRNALKHSFPGLDVGEIMLQLDKDGDQLVSPEEFRSSLAHRGASRPLQIGFSSLKLGGLFFELTAGDDCRPEGVAGDFPERMRPLMLQETVALTAADIIVDMINVSRWWKEEWPCEIRHVSLGRTMSLQRILKMLPKLSQIQCETTVLRGSISPLQKCSLPASARALAGIPPAAGYVAWCYPFEAHWAAVVKEAGIDDEDPDFAFLSRGAFLYLDEDYRFLRIMSVRHLPLGSDETSERRCGLLRFAAPRSLQPQALQRVVNTGLHPITDREFLKGGATDFCWIGAEAVGEIFDEASTPMHGGFVYIGMGLAQPA